MLSNSTMAHSIQNSSSDMNDSLRLSTDSGLNMDTDNEEQQQSKQTINTSTQSEQQRTYMSRSKKSNLIFSVSRVENRLRQGLYAERIGSTASVYLASVLEYLVAEVVELAGDMTHKSKRKRITPRDIALVIKNDAELATLCSDVTIPEGGVQPFIHQVLLNKNKRRSTYRSQKRQKHVENSTSTKSNSKRKQTMLNSSTQTETDNNVPSYSSDFDDSGVQM